METPDTTKAQYGSLLTTVVPAVIVLFKLNLTDAQQAALLTILGGLLTVGWLVSDAIIRHGRSTGPAAAKESAKTTLRAAFPPLPDEGDQASRPPGV